MPKIDKAESFVNSDSKIAESELFDVSKYEFKKKSGDIGEFW